MGLVNEAKVKAFEEALEENIYFTTEGIEEANTLITLPKSFVSIVKAWSAICTEPNEGEDYYRNPRAMFVALDLIYRLLDCLEV